MFGSWSDESTVPVAVLVEASSVIAPVWSAPALGASFTLPTWELITE